jgi:hypothetical protein
MQHELRADREVLLAAMQRKGQQLRYACAELNAERDVVLAAVHQNGLDWRWSMRLH